MLQLFCALIAGEQEQVGSVVHVSVSEYDSLSTLKDAVKLPELVSRHFLCLLVDMCGLLLSVFGTVNIADDQCYELVNNASEKQYNMFAFDVERLRLPCKDTAELHGNPESTELQYVKQLHNMVFEVRDGQGNELVVKFAARYGREMHAYCASEGFAQQLLYHEALVSGWHFVAMTKLDLMTPPVMRTSAALATVADGQDHHPHALDRPHWWEDGVSAPSANALLVFAEEVTVSP